MSKKRKSIKKKYTVFVSLIFLGVIISLTYLFAKCALSVYDMYNTKNKLSNELVDLKKDEEKLTSEVEKLNDKEYIARYAREKYLYSADGEFIIKLPTDDKNNTDDNK